MSPPAAAPTAANGDKPDALGIEGLVSLTVQKTVLRTGIRKPAVYRLLAAGRLKSFRLGGRRYVEAASLRELIASLMAQPEDDPGAAHQRGKDGRWDGSREYSLIGFVSIELMVGLTIFDCPIRMSGGRCWVGLPAKPMLDHDRQLIIENGRPKYNAVMRWRDRDLADHFSQKVIELVRQRDPDALEPTA